MESPRQPRAERATQSRRAAAARPALAGLGRCPSFRVRWGREPRDSFDGFVTLEVGSLSTDDALAAHLSTVHALETLLIVDARRSLSGRAEHMSRALTALFERQGLSRSLVVDERTLRLLLQQTPRRLTVARIEGPVDDADARALELAIRRGCAPLAAELRASTIVQLAPARHAGNSVWAQFRHDARARTFIGQCFARWAGRATGHEGPLPVPADTVVRRALAADRTIRARDLRDVTGMLDIIVRTARGRMDCRITLDRATSMWFV